MTPRLRRAPRRAAPLAARARDVFAALVATVVDPVPPLPALTPGGAPAFLDRLLAASPRLNAAGLTAALLALDALPLARHGRRFRRLPAPARLELLAELERRPATRPLLQALRGVAHLAYYGEDDAARALGYDADAVLVAHS